MSKPNLTEAQINTFFARNYRQPATTPATVVAQTLTAIEWPNRLGWDVNGAEVWKLANGVLRVVTATKYANVKSTSDPLEAYKLATARGLSRYALSYEMEPWEADKAVLANVL